MTRTLKILQHGILTLAEMQMKELAGTGMVEVYNHQYLWNNRQYQKVYDAFVDIWGQRNYG